MDNIIDLGSWICPTSWEELDLKTYQEIEKYYADKDNGFDVREVIHIICNKTLDEVNALPLEFLDMIMNKLMFLQEKPKETEPLNYIDIDGERYVVHTEKKLKVGEYIATDTVLRNDKHNYAAIMAILCRREDEEYDSTFENELLEDRIKLFEKQSIMKILPIVNFFLQRCVISMSLTPLYSKVREAIDLTRKNIENSAKNGEVSRRYMKSAMKSLRKLEKSIDGI